MSPKRQPNGSITTLIKAVFKIVQSTDYHDRETVESIKQGVANNTELNLGLRYRIIKKIEQILHRKEY